MRAPDSELPILLTDVSICLPRATTILDRISLTLTPGAPTLVVGPNGAGKTTLLRLAMGLLKPSSGCVTWAGHPQGNSMRRAIVFQRPVMLRRSAADNVRYALCAAGSERRERAARANELLALVGLLAIGQRPARKLSSGEQQRLALARALAKGPRVLFLDEPTASLDPAATKSVEDLIRDVSACGIKIVMSTHDLGAAKRLGGDIVLMHRGRIVETAEVTAFFNHPKTPEARRFISGELLI
jgi:tungstate transport system ATP-binding protein